MPDTASSSAPSSRNQILEDAWLRYAKYDKNATIAQKRFLRQRRWILILGVAATIFAVSYSVAEPHIQPQPPLVSGVANKDLLHFPVLVVPILLGVLVAFSVKFNMGVNWVMLRSSAEAIKKEIYRYRMKVSEYNPNPANPVKLAPAESRDVRLALALKVVSKRLMQTPVNQTDLLPAYDDDLPPNKGTAKGDDGFSDLTAEQYLAWRVDDQFNYYQRKATGLGKNLRRFQLVIFLLSAIGTLLAGLGFDVWIAVSGALAAAVAAYLEFLRVEPTVIAFNISAADLYDIRVWWHALSPEARTERVSIETLVASTEAVLQTENAGWLQEMREALAEIYGDKGDKKDKEPHDGSKLLDVSPAFQPDPRAGLPGLDAVVQTATEPKPDAVSVAPKDPSNEAQKPLVPMTDVVLHATEPPDEHSDGLKPEIAINVSDPTAGEASR